MLGTRARPYEAVTFDFWNTLMVEPEGGLERARVQLWRQLLVETGQPRSEAQLRAAHARATEEQQAAWRANVQYVTADAVRRMTDDLGLRLSPVKAEVFGEVFVEAGVLAGVECCSSVCEVVDRLLASDVRLAVICDIGLTPASGVRALLSSVDLLDGFETTVFSDEVGVYKPHRRMFETALRRLDVDPARALHVGDRRRTDVDGALRVGMDAARYHAIFDDDDARLRDAPHVIAELDELVDLCGVS
jgi:FMN phosphatase YigB (HAD superfamily)